MNIGRDNKPVHSMEINGDLHITNTSDLINKDYKLNRLSYDTSNNFTLMERDFVKISDFELGFNHSLIRNESDVYMVGRNIDGELGLSLTKKQLSYYKKIVDFDGLKKLS